MASIAFDRIHLAHFSHFHRNWHWRVDTLREYAKLEQVLADVEKNVVKIEEKR